jgi:hypothetical protein
MNARLVIDAIVRQTMVLIAQLATSGGLRAPLAHIASQVFVNLAKELESQGVPKKVTADMFGMALRTYQRRTQRLSQSQTDRGRSLWEAVHEFVQQSGVVTRDEVLRRFRNDDEASVRGVLRDLTESGLVFTTGTGRSLTYRGTTTEEMRSAGPSDDDAGVEAFVWSVVYREQPATIDQLSAASGLPLPELQPIIASLVGTGRVERDVTGVYRTHELVLGFEEPAGWEAAVLDHFSIVVRTITQKLAIDQRATRTDEVGGSTYHFALWRGHPHEEEVLAELRRFRERMSALRDRIDRYNLDHPEQPQRLRVDAYYGQTVTEEEDHDSDSAPDHE